MTKGRNIAGKCGAGRMVPARRLLWCLLLLPFLAASLIQSDTMLTRSAQGRIMVVLCGSDIPVEMVIAADGTISPVSDHGGTDHHHDTCAWALHGQPALGLAAAGLAPPQQVQLPLGLSPAQATGLRRSALFEPAARGPPFPA